MFKKLLYRIILFTIFSIWAAFLSAVEIQVISGTDVWGRQDVLYYGTYFNSNNEAFTGFFSDSYRSVSQETFSAEAIFPYKDVSFGIGLSYPSQRKLIDYGYDYNLYNFVDVPYSFLPVFLTARSNLTTIKSIDLKAEVLGQAGIAYWRIKEGQNYNGKNSMYWGMGLEFVKGHFVLQSLYQVVRIKPHDNHIIMDTHLNVSLGMRF